MNLKLRVSRSFLAALTATALVLTPMAAAACRGSDVFKRISSEAHASISRQADKVPFSRGNHWVATRRGQTIHVVGTMHSSDSRMGAVMRNLRPLIAASDVVFLESLDPPGEHSREQQLKFLREFLLPKNTNLMDVMPEKDALNALTVAMDIGIPHQMAAVLQPWVLSYFLSGSRCRGKGLFGTRGLDDRIMKHATSKRIPIGGLESQFDALRALSGLSMRDQVSLLRLHVAARSANLVTDNDDWAITQREAYFNETLTEARILKDMVQFRELDFPQAEAARVSRKQDTLLLDRRNKLWMPVLLKRREARIFVAVGAAHLPGRNGVLNLLRQNGFKLQRAAF